MKNIYHFYIFIFHSKLPSESVPLTRAIALVLILILIIHFYPSR